MSTKRPFIPPARRALLLVAALAAGGCPDGSARVPPHTAPVQPPPVQVVPPPAPSAPVPSEADLAWQAAHGAEVRGEHGAAIELYRKAEALTRDGERLADIHYALAVLQADPNNPQRNLDESRAELQRFAAASPDHPRGREARVIETLIDEAAQVRTESTTMRTELDALKVEVASLKTRLDEKEKELAGIKKVLLQNKTKP